MLAGSRARRLIRPVGVRDRFGFLASSSSRAESDMATDSTTTPVPDQEVAGPPRPRQAPDAERPAEPAAPPRRPPLGRRLLHRLPRYPWSGTLGAVLLGCSSLTPSLLPRGWLLQGVIAGLTAAIGYGIGGGLAWFVRELTDRRPGPIGRRRAWLVLAVLGTVLVVVMLWWGHRWQAEIDRLMGLDAPAGYTAAGLVVVARWSSPP